MGLPDGWNSYDRVGKQVHGTRFIAFKVPLREGLNKANQVPEEKQLYPKLLVSLIPKLGLVIDLTNTTKYYNPEEFLDLGIKYQKILVEGHVIPSNQCSMIFRETVNTFLAENENNDKLIGVHCTHGLNRSGFLVCRYMIEELQIPPLEAIAAFEIARGHKMERDNYLSKLKRLTVDGVASKIPKKEKLPSLAIDTECDKGTQTNRGFWINETSIPPHHRSLTSGTLDTSNQPSKHVSLVGCVNIQKRELIPDGQGGYFVHITKKEIQRNEGQRNDSRRNDNHRNDIRFDNQRYDNQRRGNRPNLPHKRQSNQSIQSHRPYMQRPRVPDDHSMGMLMPPFMANQLPLGSNNLAADLLRMQHSSGFIPRTPY